MSVDVFVQRGDGLKRGQDIDSPLVCELRVALELGRNILDKNSKSTTNSLVANYRPGVRVGQLLEVHDALQGVSWRGKLVDMSITKKSHGSGVELSLKVLRPS